MKPVLLLAAPRAGLRPERGRLDLRRVARLDAIDDADYDSVIVLNDGGVETIRRLQLALELRAHHKQLQVGVLTYLEPAGDGAGPDVLVGAGPAAVLSQLGPELCVELKDQVLSLEYQAE